MCRFGSPGVGVPRTLCLVAEPERVSSLPLCSIIVRINAALCSMSHDVDAGHDGDDEEADDEEKG